jgi:hypothetical protein
LEIENKEETYVIFVLELITSKRKAVLTGDRSNRLFVRFLLILETGGGAIQTELVRVAETLRVLRPRRAALPVDAVVSKISATWIRRN